MMADMRAAGLNPMLAYSQSPGPSPSGNVADTSAIGAGFSEAGRIASSAYQSYQAGRAAKESARLSGEQARTERTRRELMASERELNIARAGTERSTQALNFQKRLGVDAQIREIDQKILQSKGAVDQIAAQTDLTRAQVRDAMAKLKTFIRTGKSPIGSWWDSIAKISDHLGSEFMSMIQDLRKGK
jgi:hypothetical protein